MKEMTKDQTKKPNKNLTEIAVILDRSGSMAGVRSTTIEQFNSFLAGQKKIPGECLMTVVQFDDQYEVMHDGVNIQGVDLFAERDFAPRGMTRLYDAIGKTVNTIADRHAKMSIADRPSKVLVAILTDGNENNSVEFRDKKQIEDIINEREETGWKFIYLSAHPDAFKSAGAIGLSKGSTVSTGSGMRGQSVAYNALHNAAVSYRATGDIGDLSSHGEDQQEED